MTPNQADQTLLHLATTWNTKITDPTIATWRKRLQNHDYTTTNQAINQLADTNKHWPAWSEIIETIKTINRTNQPHHTQLKRTQPTCTKTENLQHIHNIRQHLTKP